MHHMSKEMQQCIADCGQCAHVCFETAMHHCLEVGGEHVEPRHFRLMMACAEICKTASSVMITGIEEHKAVCGACADICKACGDNCEQVGDMSDCVEVCRRCEESCRQMTGKMSMAS